MAGQVGIALDNASLFTDLQRSNTDLFNAFDSTIEGWSHALDLRDKETKGHSQRVTEMTVKLARSLGLGEEELVQVRWGALLHDIGKMGISGWDPAQARTADERRMVCNEKAPRLCL